MLHITVCQHYVLCMKIIWEYMYDPKYWNVFASVSVYLHCPSILVMCAQHSIYGITVKVVLELQ